MKIEHARIVEHRDVAGGYRVLSLEAGDIARAVRPGQFVHLRVPDLAAALRRPFSVYRADGDRLALLYKTVGRGTGVLARVGVGGVVDLLGPLGNGFPAPDATCTPVLVAGGYGVAPLSLLAARTPGKGVVFIGGRTADDILCTADFASLGWEVRIATENGSAGARGVVTDLLDTWLSGAGAGSKPEFFACGPDGMLRAVGARAVRRGCRAWLSLDKHMGCGVGACLACVQRIRDAAGNVAWKRVCKDGPVFEAREIVW